MKEPENSIIRILSAQDTGYTFNHGGIISDLAVIWINEGHQYLIIDNYGDSSDPSKNTIISLNIELLNALHGE